MSWRYDSPLQEVSDRINDTYLKTFDVENGIASYGEVVDYLIAWYLNGSQCYGFRFCIRNKCDKLIP